MPVITLTHKQDEEINQTLCNILVPIEFCTEPIIAIITTQFTNPVYYVPSKYKDSNEKCPICSPET